MASLFKLRLPSGRVVEFRQKRITELRNDIVGVVRGGILQLQYVRHAQPSETGYPFQARFKVGDKGWMSFWIDVDDLEAFSDSFRPHEVWDDSTRIRARDLWEQTDFGLKSVVPDVFRILAGFLKSKSVNTHAIIQSRFPKEMTLPPRAHNADGEDDDGGNEDDEEMEPATTRQTADKNRGEGGDWPYIFQFQVACLELAIKFKILVLVELLAIEIQFAWRKYSHDHHRLRAVLPYIRNELKEFWAAWVFDEDACEVIWGQKLLYMQELTEHEPAFRQFLAGALKEEGEEEDDDDLVGKFPRVARLVGWERPEPAAPVRQDTKTPSRRSQRAARNAAKTAEMEETEKTEAYAASFKR